MREIRHHSVEEFENLFLNQAGYGLPVYHGQSVQRGYGLGNILASAFRSAMPLIKKGISYLGRKFLNTGAKVVTDVASGVPVKTSLKSRAKTAGRETIISAADTIEKMTGSGIKKKRQRKPKVTTRKARAKRTPLKIPSDIFSR